MTGQEIRPGYKQTEVGVIPEDWDAVPLEKVGNFKNGINKPAEAFGAGFPFVNLMDVFGVDQISSNRELDLLDSSPVERKLYDLRAGDVLFIRSSVKPSGVGLTTLVESDLEDTVFSGFLLRFRDRGQLAPQFKRYCFFDARFRDSIIASSTVSANTNINQSSLKKLFLAVPQTLDEQRAIAAALSDADGLIAALEAVIAKKRDLKQAAMQRLLTGKTRLPGFSGEWEVKRLGEVAAIRNDKINTLGTEAAAFCVELEQVGQNTGQIDGHSDARGRRSVKYHFRQGDVLFGRLRPYLRKFWWANCDGVCSTEIWPLVPIGGRLVSGFLFQTVQTDDFIEAANLSYGTHMPRSDWKALRQFEVSVPSDPNEQTAIAEVLSDMDADLAAYEARVAKARAVKQGMMQELLTGKMRLV